MTILHNTLLAAAVALAFAAPAQAVTNGSFESALTGWSAIGDVSIDNIFVSQGNVGVLLGTASIDFEDDAPLLGAGQANFSGISAAPVGTVGGVEDFIGLPMGGLDPDAANGIAAFEGSAIKQSFAVNAGDKLSFDWQFATIDPWQGDYAFVTINQTAYRLGDLASVSGVQNDIGFSTPATFSYTFTASGNVTLALGVVDVQDYNGTSALLVDNVQLAPVPEPESYAMLLAGLGLVGFAARRKSA